MFDKLAEDIEKRYWQKLAALEKEAAKWKGSVADPSLAMLKRQQGAMSKIDPYSKPGYRKIMKKYDAYSNLEIDNAIRHQGENVLHGDKLVKAPNRRHADSTEKSKGIMENQEGRAALDTFLHAVNKNDSDFVRRMIRETSQNKTLSQEDYSRLIKMEGGTTTGSYTDGLTKPETSIFNKLHPNLEISGDPMTTEQIAKKISDKESGDIFSRRGFRDNALQHLLGRTDSAFFSPPYIFDNRNYGYVKYPGDYVGLISRNKSRPVMTSEEFNDSFRISSHTGNKNPKLRKYIEALEDSDPNVYEAVIQRPVLQKAMDNGSAGFYKDLGYGRMAPVSVRYPDQTLAGKRSSNIQAPTLNNMDMNSLENTKKHYNNNPEDVKRLIQEIVLGHPINYYTDDSFLQNIPYDRFLPLGNK